MFLFASPLPGLTSCQVDARRGAQAFAGRADRGQHVFQGVVELRVLQGVVPQGPEQLPLSALRGSWGTGGQVRTVCVNGSADGQNWFVRSPRESCVSAADTLMGARKMFAVASRLARARNRL